MSIKLNVVTWYSKLLSILFFIAVLPVLTFYIGMKYQETVEVIGAQSVSLVPSILRIEKNTVPKIDIGESTLEGKTFGIIRNIYEQNGKLWVNIDPAEQISTLDCVFRAFDTNMSRECSSSNGLVSWNISTSTIAIPLGEKATVAVYYNDGSTIGLKPKVVTTKNGKNAKLYVYSLSQILPAVASNSNLSISLISSSTTIPTATSSSLTASTTPNNLTTLKSLAALYNRIFSYNGDDSYRWSPIVAIDVKAVRTNASTSGKNKDSTQYTDSGSTSEVVSIEEVWQP